MTHLAGGVPFSFTAHAKDLYTTLPRNVVIRAKAARFVITCTGFNRRFLEGLLGDAPVSIHVLYHGTNLSRFKPAGQQAERGRIVSVGRLVPKKGFPHLIEALGLLHREGIGFACDIYGGGPMREELTLQASARDLSHLVKLHGARLQDDILAAYRTAAVVALAPVVTDDGDRDGIPNVLVEAMACAVERLLTDAELAARLAGAGRRKVERLFDVSTNSQVLVDLFTESDSGLAEGGTAG
jgi:glycosyltransferase involved in cell wall biosynthesis